ncbi:MAG: glycoside hydrolase family 47 protein, partial [Dokdonella sp.]
MKKIIIAFSLLLSSHFAWSVEAPAPTAIDAAESARLAAEVKTEFLHAWKDYRKYAWGHDDLAPLTHKAHDWYAEPLLMTPVDALDTLVIMGLTDEADA